MPYIDTAGSVTLHLTDDEYAAVCEHVQQHASDSELCRVLAEARPAELPIVLPVMGDIEVSPPASPDDPAPAPVVVQAQVGELRYTYAITVPPADQQIASDALRAEGHDDAATTVAENDPEEI